MKVFLYVVDITLTLFLTQHFTDLEDFHGMFCYAFMTVVMSSVFYCLICFFMYSELMVKSLAKPGGVYSFL